MRHQSEKGVFNRLLVPEKQCALSKIIEYESREHHGKPGELDREAAEMAHVSVERLAAGDCEGDGAEHEEAGHRGGNKDADGMARV